MTIPPEERLALLIADEGLPEPKRQWRFCPGRKWEADFGWPFAGICGVICEVEGGTWMRVKGGRSGGHAHPVRFEKDCEKYNEAEIMLIVVIRVTPKMIDDGRAIEWIKRALKGSGR